MNYLMTSRTVRAITVKVFTLVSVLLLTACDGGIFGTGGTLDSSSGEPVAETGLSTDGTSVTGSAATPDVDTTVGDTGNVDAGNDTDSTPASPDSNTDPDVDTDTVATPGIDPSANPAVDPGEDTSIPTTDEITDAGATDSDATDTDTGTDDGGATDAGTADGGSSTNNSSLSVGDEGTFTNNTRTLSGSEAQLVVANTSSLTINVISLNEEQNAGLFEIAGVTPNTLSSTTALGTNTTSLAIVDSSNPTQALIVYSEFNADPQTLTTLLIREDDSGINSVALVTETQTSDPGLARVRIVQGESLGNPLLMTEFRLQSSGDNPGGMDINFGPLSFDQPQSDYKELLAGDYELIDLANRFAPVPVTLSGGTVYTLVITGNGTDDVLTIIDSDTQ